MLVLVVGPSGAGKDALLSAARQKLADDPRFVFPRRVVTRDPVAAAEDHDSLTPDEFARRRAQGDYALTWEAHGLSYGLPASILADAAAGRVVVVNASRTMIGGAAARFRGTRVLRIDAPYELRAQRLAGRGRETEAAIDARLRREAVEVPADAVTIDNSGSLAAGSALFIAALRQFAQG